MLSSTALGEPHVSEPLCCSVFFGKCVVWRAAWSTGFVLENVRLKVEAFDYLQLPFVFTEGCIGRLEVQARTHCISPIVHAWSRSALPLFTIG